MAIPGEVVSDLAPVGVEAREVGEVALLLRGGQEAIKEIYQFRNRLARRQPPVQLGLDMGTDEVEAHEGRR